MGLPKIDISALSPEERMDLLERIWDSFSGTPEAFPVPDSHRAELRRRIGELERSGEEGRTWSEVREGIRRNRLGDE